MTQDPGGGASVFFGQEVTVSLHVVRMGERSLTFGFEIWGEEFHGTPRRRAAAGSYVTVHLAGQHGGGARSEPWPQAWIDRLRRP
jgi:acyl-CoA thioester hydrolase